MSELPIDRVVCGDAIELMREKIPDASIHAIVTDPPYGLEFMGEEWDTFQEKGQGKGWQIAGKPSLEKFDGRNDWHSKSRPAFRGHTIEHWRNYQQWTTTWAREALRVLKPGASMFVMGGTRTYHRMACGVEDAGFTVKDTLLWCYNSGFPKAQDLGKMIDRRAGAERDVIGKTSRHNSREFGRGTGDVDYGHYTGGVPDLTTPTTPLAREWEGWKVGGLKPSYEPIVWAVKPPEGAMIDNALKHGVGAVNVDACRIPFEDKDDAETAHNNALGPVERYKTHKMIYGGGRKSAGFQDTHSSQGRYPANMVRTDRFEDEYDRFYFVPKASRAERDEGLDDVDEKLFGQSGGARQALKKGQKEYLKNHIGLNVIKKVKNIHPTVKPIRLGEHLIKLVTRPGQTVADFFCGSGSFLIAARRLNRCYIGFDNNPEYIEIAKRRLAAVLKPLEAYE